jgi:hypothetical protein
MKFLRVFLSAAFVLATFPELRAQGQQTPADVPKIKITPSLVFLDVTVLDKKGRPVVSGLSEDDFTITEDNTPQRVFSFEAPRPMSPTRTQVIATLREQPRSPF